MGADASRQCFGPDPKSSKVAPPTDFSADLSIPKKATRGGPPQPRRTGSARRLKRRGSLRGDEGHGGEKEKSEKQRNTHSDSGSDKEENQHKQVNTNTAPTAGDQEQSVGTRTPAGSVVDTRVKKEVEKKGRLLAQINEEQQQPNTARTDASNASTVDPEEVAYHPYQGLSDEWRKKLTNRFGKDPSNSFLVQLPQYSTGIPELLLQMKDLLYTHPEGLNRAFLFKYNVKPDELASVVKALDEGSCNEPPSNILSLSTAIKYYYDALPTRLLDNVERGILLNCESEDDALHVYSKLLSPIHSNTLRFLIDIANDVVAKSDSNLMDEHSIAMVLSPYLYSVSDEQMRETPFEVMEMSKAAVKFFKLAMKVRVREILEEVEAIERRAASTSREASKEREKGDAADASPHPPPRPRRKSVSFIEPKKKKKGKSKSRSRSRRRKR